MNIKNLIKKIVVSLISFSLILGQSSLVQADNFTGAITQGWKQSGATWNYLKNGVMATGWLKDGSTWYCLNPNGVMLSNTWIGNYYLGADGAMAVNKVVDGGWVVGADGNWNGRPKNDVVTNNQYSVFNNVNKTYIKSFDNGIFTFKSNDAGWEPQDGLKSIHFDGLTLPTNINPNINYMMFQTIKGLSDSNLSSNSDYIRPLYFYKGENNISNRAKIILALDYKMQNARSFYPVVYEILTQSNKFNVYTTLRIAPLLQTDFESYKIALKPSLKALVPQEDIDQVCEAIINEYSQITYSKNYSGYSSSVKTLEFNKINLSIYYDQTGVAFSFINK